MAKRSPRRRPTAPSPFAVRRGEPTELDIAKQVDIKVMREHPDEIRLMYDLITQAHNEMARLTGVIRITNEADWFRIVMVVQSIDAGWAIIRLIRTGYPRIALATARLLREGHIALLWATAFPDEARERWKDLATESTAPPITSGAMAKAIADRLRTVDSTNAGRWDPFMRALGETHNGSFAHAATNFALREGFSRIGSEISPKVGPMYLPKLTSSAIDHLIPLFTIALQDATNTIEDLSDLTRYPDSVTAIARGGEWWDSHPIPLDVQPNYPQENAV